MDEAALYGTNTYTLLEDGHISQHTFTYEDLGMERLSCLISQVAMPRKMQRFSLVSWKMKPVLILKQQCLMRVSDSLLMVGYDY